jgi:hypothetical protein
LSGPPDDLAFFTDRDLGKRFPETLAAAGLKVVKHADLFPPDCPDETWLAKVGAEGWIAVTHDARIRYKPNERRAVIDHGVCHLPAYWSHFVFGIKEPGRFRHIGASAFSA